MLAVFCITILYCCLQWCVVGNHLSKIHIALTIDETSSKDLLIVANSVVLSAYYPRSLVFHIAACGRNLTEAEVIAGKVKKAFENCLPQISIDVKPFMLPLDSGFAKQRDFVSAEKRSHWFSPTGADMARFFLSSIFPDVDKLLYLDNDIVVSCCIEEVYRTPLEGDKIAGIVLDDLKWATVTQFQRQYNASHPLVIKNIRRQKSNDWSPVGEDEFWKALPRYPNDGVLLIDVKKYNDGNILEKASEIALANANGDYVVGMGTQQFTVLMLHDRWVELTPRANLRHFPDMARGYLMWFYYNGIIHYAGMAKPRVVCTAGGSDNEHRLGSYTPWASTVHGLVNQCPSEALIADIKKCADHIPVPDTWDNFLRIVEAVAAVNAESALVVLHLGGIAANVTASSDYHSNAATDMVTGSSGPDSQHEEHHKQKHGRGHLHHHPQSRQLSAMTSIQRYTLFHSPWSIKYIDAIDERLIDSASNIRFAFSDVQRMNITSQIREVAMQGSNGKRRLKGKNAKKGWIDNTHKGSSKRYYSTIQLNMCDGTNDYLISTIADSQQSLAGDCIDQFIPSYEQNSKMNAYESKESCRSVLQYIKANGNKHWDVIGITIDYPPTIDRPWSSSLGVLRNLDLVFMRPKFVVVKINSPIQHTRLTLGGLEQSKCGPRGHRTILDDAKEAQRILQRNGYQAFIDPSNSCEANQDEDRQRQRGSHHNHNKQRKSEHSNEENVCVWGTRVTTIELHSQDRWA